MNAGQLLGILRGGLHLLPPPLACMVSNPAFVQHIGRLDGDEEAKAALMMAALGEIALDPIVGTTPEAFFIDYPGGTLFNIQFDRIANFVGLVDLHAGSARIAGLKTDIAANLNSRRFKAAQLSRRLSHIAGRLYSQAQRRARSAYDAIRVYPGDEANQAAARAAYEAEVARRMRLVHDRVSAVSRVAAPTFTGAYTHAVAAFLHRHLPI